MARSDQPVATGEGGIDPGRLSPALHGRIAALKKSSDKIDNDATLTIWLRSKKMPNGQDREPIAEQAMAEGQTAYLTVDPRHCVLLEV
jgi:hypothetical protein